jgi:hypothetical protein
MQDSVQGACSWKKQFAWYQASPGPFSKVSIGVVDLPAAHWNTVYYPALQVADLDGDGIDDVHFQPGLPPGGAIGLT